jgi:uncharacterized repeat protein (TIGR01451 family)
LKVHWLLLLVLVLFAVNASAATINLGTAASFGLLGGSGVTNAVAGTIVQGDVGSSPTPAVTGFPPGVVVGTKYTGPSAVTAQAQSDLTIAYNAAAGAACNTDLTGQDLGGKTLVAGVYCFSSSAGLTGTLTLDGQGDPTAQWIFQIGTSLITGTGSNVVLKNGASPCHVFWQVGSSATIQTGNGFAGNIMALASVTLNGGTLQGRALARTGAVTISGSEFVNSVCVPSNPCVSITKKANRTAAAIGETIIYTYTVCNCGPTTLTVDSVNDVPLGPLTTTFTTANGGATLAVGACKAFTVNHIVTGADANPLVNTVTVTAHDATGSTSDQATESVVITPTPPATCVSIVKIADHIVAAVGDLVTYTYTICNCGTSTLTVDSVIDVPLGDQTAAFITANGGATTLAGGACKSFTATHTVLTTDPNPLSNVVTVNAHNGATPVTATDTWTIAIVSGPCLSVAKVPSSLTAAIGDTVVYTFTVCNCGTPTLTVGTMVDSHFGDLLPDLKAANLASADIAPGACVVFTKSRTVLATDVSPLTNTVTVTAHAGAVPLTETTEASVTIVARTLFQAYCGRSCVGVRNGINNGFGGITGDTISSVPGVFSFDPGGPNWPNFVPAFGVVNYTITNVILRKTVPTYVCSAAIGGRSIVQQGTANITTWWPLMYELPGTTWTLTINYTTAVPFDDDGPGPHGPTLNHVVVWTWSVGATLQSMKDLLEMFHELPLGNHQVPLVSDEVLYPVLQGKLDHIIALILAGQTGEAAIALDEFILEVEDACIAVAPPKPIASGAGTGIANTCDNPACCKILADADWVAIQLGLRNP